MLRIYDVYHMSSSARLFSRMRSKGSRFTLGVWRWRCVCLMLSNRSQPFAAVRNRPQPSATVRNRSQPFATVRVIAIWPCLLEVSAGVHHFWMFQASPSFVSRGKMWHFVACGACLVDVWKIVLRGRGNTLATLAEDVLHF